MQADVASAIGQQVEQMILQAQKDSEARVRHDLSVARSQLQQMETHIGDLGTRVGAYVQKNGGNALDQSQTVDRAFLNNKITQLESKWGSEVTALKQDLHRTILAHNHNSDLMRHHRDALDEARKKLDAQTKPRGEEVDAQCDKVERMLRAGQAKQRALEALTERLTALEQQVGDLHPAAAGGMQGAYPGMLPGGMAGLTAAMMGQPPGMEREPTTSKKKKDGEPPSEEEIRQRMLQAAAKANAAGGETSFNAEAPVFVPRGGASVPEAAASAAPIKLTSTLGGSGLLGDDEEGEDATADGVGEGDDDEADEVD
jgi:polyhydroxyalkanoate synthesis regulator phasin